MELHRTGREHIYIPFAADVLDLTNPEVQVDAQWYPAEVVELATPALLPDGTSTSRAVRFLAAGPDAAPPDESAVVMAQGTHTLRIRFADTPEVFVRRAGAIRIT